MHVFDLAETYVYALAHIHMYSTVFLYGHGCIFCSIKLNMHQPQRVLYVSALAGTCWRTQTFATRARAQMNDIMMHDQVAQY